MSHDKKDVLMQSVRRSGRGIKGATLILMLVMLCGVASASGLPATHSGGGTLSLGPPTLIWERTVGNHTITLEDGSLSFQGTILGAGTITVLAVVHPTTGETFVAKWSAPATIDGRSGALTIRAEGTDNGTFSSRFVADGSGGLARFHGEGQLTGQDATGQGTYTVTYVDGP